MTQPDRCDLLRDLRTARDHVADALYAAGPCVFTLRDAAVLRERRNRCGGR